LIAWRGNLAFGDQRSDGIAMSIEKTEDFDSEPPVQLLMDKVRVSDEK